MAATTAVNPRVARVIRLAIAAPMLTPRAA